MLEPMKRETANTGTPAQGEGGVDVAQVVEAALRVDSGSPLGGLPVTATEATEVDTAAARVREQDLAL
jgi:hypothetical protein